jgi:murein DD-endopeptidase MepM/ murein hydrolase activator NlpD
MNIKPNNFEHITKKRFPITSKFGKRRLFGGLQFHNGIDIATPRNTEIICPADGIVIEVNSNAIAGNYLRIQHNCGLITGYAHLNKVIVKTNQEVTKGQVVALTGNTGLSTGPHLHFTCFEDGEFRNPELYFDF